jgi:hypothetical protein
MARFLTYSFNTKEKKMRTKIRNLVNWFGLIFSIVLFVLDIIQERFLLMVVALILILQFSQNLQLGRRKNIE